MSTNFTRQPRFLPEMITGEIDIPNPPSAYEKPEISWFTLLAPPAVMLCISILISMNSNSIFLLISVATTIMTLIVSLMNATTQIKKYVNMKKKRQKNYLQFISDIRSELTIVKEQQIRKL